MAQTEKPSLLDNQFVHAERTVLDEEVLSLTRKMKRWRAASGDLWRMALSIACGYFLYSVCFRRCITCTTRFDQTRESPLQIISNYTCIPGRPCWPSSDDWAAFNQSINGRLRLTVPLAAPCYASSSSSECQHVAQEYTDAMSRAAHYGAMEFLDWEMCGASHCFLNSSVPASESCSLGRLSTYHVEAHTAHHVSETVNFVRQHGIRLSIKNTGHDYFGRSNAANSLAIWTHSMKDTKYFQTFQPQGCKSRYENIGEVGAGIQAHEAVKFFESLGMLVTVGAVPSVGIAGGFGQGGGHGPLGPTYGLMVDQAVEFDVVTADGQRRTINECTDPDLFWAMRGGGGSTYAVLTAYRFQLHPAVPINVYSFQARLPVARAALNITQSDVHRDILRALALNQTMFASHGIAGYTFLFADQILSLHVMPSADASAIQSITSQWRDFLVHYPGLEIRNNSYHSFPLFSQWVDFTEQPTISHNGPVGLGIMEAGRFLPRKLFDSSEDIDRVVDAVVTAMEFTHSKLGSCGVQLYATGPFHHTDNHKTGTNPVWRDSLWEVIMAAAWTTDMSPSHRKKTRHAISASIDSLKELTPGGGCYMNEGDWTEEDWQQTFFGDNYDRLLAVKREYDPTALFNCWKCVGWTGHEDPLYSCYAE